MFEAHIPLNGGHFEIGRPGESRPPVASKIENLFSQDFIIFNYFYLLQREAVEFIRLR
jgi:hypothetical protein